jgi:hypothetical protein
MHGYHLAVGIGAACVLAAAATALLGFRRPSALFLTRDLGGVTGPPGAAADEGGEAG